MNRFNRLILTVAARAASRVKRFVRATEAVAVVEFALILPFMLVVYIGSEETSMVVSLDRRVSNVAGSLGDLVSRADATITTAELDDFFGAASLVLSPYDATTLKQVVTCVHLFSNNTTSIAWSQGFNGAVAHTVGAPYTLPSELTSIVGDTYVIISEAQISYLPLGGEIIKNPITLYKEYYYLPRFGALINLI